MEGQLHFISGLPRSGSTVLCNLLNQNPNYYCTPTSGLVQLFNAVHSSWVNVVEFKAQGLENIKSNVSDSMGGLLRGYHKEHLVKGTHVFDKCRGWPRFIEELNFVLDQPPKIICMIRDPREICGSFEKLYRNRDISWLRDAPELSMQETTLPGRINLWLNPNGMLGYPINIIRDAIARRPECLLLVPYKYFMSNPMDVMDSVHSFIGVENFDYDPNDIQQTTHEDDNYYGMNLHKIKKSINKIQRDEAEWKEFVPGPIAKEIEENYKDIITLAREKECLTPHNIDEQ